MTNSFIDVYTVVATFELQHWLELGLVIIIALGAFERLIKGKE
jgi:hypothetical protein